MDIELLAYFPRFFKGALLSLNVAVLSLVGSCVFGFILAYLKLSNLRVLRLLATAYTGMVRGVPDLVMMFLIFFGSQVLLNKITESYQLEHIDLDAFSAGVITLTIIFSAFMAETFRAAMLAVDRAQLETARAFGMSSWQVTYRILIPQMCLHALPGFSNNWLVLIKSTAILSVIGLHDMIYIASVASRSTHQPFVFYFAASLIYLLITWLSVLALKRVEKYYHLEQQV